MNDLELHHRFKKLGTIRNRITYKLLALLPKIAARKIYEKKGYRTVHEYAARLAGLTPDVVTKALAVAKKLSDKPLLQAQIEKVGVHKVALVASLATSETEKIWAEKVESMSKKTLEVFTKEYRQTGSFDSGRAADENLKIELDHEMQKMFYKLKKEIGANLSNKEALRVILLKFGNGERNLNCEKIGKKENRVKKVKDGNNWTVANSAINVDVKTVDNVVNKPNSSIPGKNFDKKEKIMSGERENVKYKTETRYIQAKIKKETIAKTAGTCAYQNCTKAIENLHHQTPYSVRKTHEDLVGLCKEHHEMAHQSNSETDQIYRQYKMVL